MMIYLLKFVACTGVLLLFYHFILQNDRLFKFNRFFLLAIVGLALLIPNTTVRTNYIEIPATPALSYQTADVSEQSFQPVPQGEFISEPSKTSVLSTKQVLIIFYLLVTVLLLVRFGLNLLAINRLKKSGDIVTQEGINIVLRSDIPASFSFLNYMFTNKERYEQGNLPIEIIQHEKLHIKQNHSIDIIFIELLQCIFWFNPFIYFIRKAIKLNHEFLADAFVIGGNPSAYNYQKILLEFTGKHLLKSPLLASNLNYGFTKKRLNMMVKKTNIWVAVLKQSCALLLITATFWSLGITKTVAQEAAQEVAKKEAITSNTDEKVQPKAPQISQRQGFDGRKVKYGVAGLRDNNKIRFKNESGQLIEKKASELTESEKETFLYPEADAEWYRIPPPVLRIKQEQLDDFLSPTKYGVWLDDKRVDNEVLANYKPEDIHHYSKSGLAKNAKNYGKHTFQVNLTTVEYAKTKPYFQAGWRPFHRQWRFSVKKPDNVGATAYNYTTGNVRNNSTVRYTNEAGQLIETTFSAINKAEKKWLEHPNRKLEVLLPAKKKALFNQKVLDKYQDSKKYGIWVDGKKVDNSELMNYPIGEFHHLRTFRLSKKAQADKGYISQVIFYTEDGASKLPSANDRWIPVNVDYMIIQYILVQNDN